MLKNADYYSFLVHLCQKQYYNLNKIKEQPETFLDELIQEMSKEGLLNAGEWKTGFYIRFEGEENREPDVIDIYGNEVKNIEFLADGAAEDSNTENERNGDGNGR